MSMDKQMLREHVLDLLTRLLVDMSVHGELMALALQDNEDGQFVKEIVLMACQEDVLTFCKVFHPGRFPKPFSAMHFDLGKMLNSKCQRGVVMMPRGAGKTSILKADAEKALLFKQANYLMYVGATLEMAQQHANDIRQDFEDNELIKAWFGDLKTEAWSQERWTLANGAHCFPRGYGSKVRGQNYRGKRPDYILVDDLEDEETVNSEVLRKKVVRWFFSALRGCVEMGSKTWRMRVVGTLLHEGSILLKLMASKIWQRIRWAICDENFHSLCPSWMSDQEIMDVVEEFREQGELDSFYREYMNMPVATENRPFRKEMFKHYEEPLQIEEKTMLDSFVMVDPARTTNLSSDDTAIVGVSMDCTGRRIYVRDIVHGKLHPDDMYREAFAMADRIGARVIGVEITGLNEFITVPMQNMARAEGKSFQVVPLKGGTKKKEDRILQSLQTYYRQGLVYHNSACCTILELQLIAFPRSERDDVMDALSYISTMIDSGERLWAAGETKEELMAELEEVGWNRRMYDRGTPYLEDIA